MRQKLLLWATLAYRPIRVPEMQYAWVTIEGKKSFNPDVVVLPTVKQMVASCGPLLEVSNEDTLRFTHRTVKEFLLQPLDKLSEDACKDEKIMSCMVNEREGHAKIAITCGRPQFLIRFNRYLTIFLVTQLFSDGLNQLEATVRSQDNHNEKMTEGMNKKGDERGIPLSSSPFDYAVSNWLKHAMEVRRGIDKTSLSRELWELVRDLFWDQDREVFMEWIRVFASGNEDWHQTGGLSRCLHFLKSHITRTSIAASYGLVDIIEWAHPDGVEFDVSDGYGYTPLIWAAGCGEDGVVKTLLSKHSVRINQTACLISAGIQCWEGNCGDGHTALMEAVMYRYPAVAKSLLERPDIDVDLVSHGKTAPGLAIDANDMDAIKLLVGAGAKLAIRNGKVLEIPS
jgi:hypothetical protein